MGDGAGDVFDSIRRSARTSIRAALEAGGDVSGAVREVFEPVAKGPAMVRAAAVLGMLDAESEWGGPGFARVRAALAAAIVPARPRKDGGRALVPVTAGRRIPRR